MNIRSGEIWRNSNVHTAFLLRTAERSDDFGSVEAARQRRRFSSCGAVFFGVLNLRMTHNPSRPSSEPCRWYSTAGCGLL